MTDDMLELLLRDIFRELMTIRKLLERRHGGA